MSVIRTPEHLVAFLGLAPDAGPDAVRAAIVNGVVGTDEAAIEAALDRRYFPELIASAAPPTASREAAVDDALGAPPGARTLPGYA